MTLKKPPSKTVVLPERFSSQPRVKQPTPQQVKALREKSSLTQSQAGALLYIDTDTWRQYEKTREQPNARQMRPALWELFQLKVGAIECSAYELKKPAFGRAPAAAATFKRAAPVKP
jgi:DNA-binding XRE family transcriptional regulator